MNLSQALGGRKSKHLPVQIGYDHTGQPIDWCTRCGAIRRRRLGRWAIWNKTRTWGKPTHARDRVCK